MTRINCGIPPKKLVMQHLIAEHREIIRIPNTIASGKAVIRDIPEDFRLGSGHVKFFYDKLYYLKKRYISLYNECKSRGYNVQNYTECFDNLPENLMNDYQPTTKDKLIVIDRINDKLEKMKKNIRLDLESLEDVVNFSNENIQSVVNRECNINLPEFENEKKAHDWRNHIPDEIKGIWLELTDREKILLAFSANKSADSEEWD